MKIKNFWVAFGAVFVFFVLANCVFGQPTQTKEDILNLIPQQWRDRDSGAMGRLADKIIADNNELANYFASTTLTKNDKKLRIKNKYDEMNGQIVDKKYEVFSSKHDASFNRFWDEAWEQGNTIGYTVKSIYVTDAIGEKEVDGLKFNYVALVVSEITIQKSGSAPRGPAYDDLDIRVSRHQTNCTW